MSWGDPFARYYHEYGDDPSHWREIFERIGRIVVAWGAAESAVAKMWWHKAFEAGTELSPDKVYRATMSDKLKQLRKLIPLDGSRSDMQLRRLEQGIPELEPERHALVHGYIGLTPNGPAATNLRTDYRTAAADLPSVYAWAVFLADVAHQLYEEATCHIYRGQGKLVLPDPVEPPPLRRSA